jgi:hypothetical protein
MKPLRDEGYLLYVAGLPCAAHDDQCMGDVVAHHIKTAGRGIKDDNYKTVPLCVFHHRYYHDHGCIEPFNHDGTLLYFYALALDNLCQWMRSI